MPQGANKAASRPPSKTEKASKTRRINNEIARLMKSFAEMPEDKKRVVDGLIKEAAYMRVTLEDWRKELDAEGWTELFTQSEAVPPYQKKKAKAEMYLSMNPAYQKIISQLSTHLAKSGGGDGDDDGFDGFVNNR